MRRAFAVGRFCLSSASSTVADVPQGTLLLVVCASMRINQLVLVVSIVISTGISIYQGGPAARPGSPRPGPSRRGASRPAAPRS